LRLLKEREDLKTLRVAELRKEIRIGIEQAERGEFVDGPQAFEKIRHRSAAPCRSWLRLGLQQSLMRRLAS